MRRLRSLSAAPAGITQDMIENLFEGIRVWYGVWMGGQVTGYVRDYLKKKGSPVPSGKVLRLLISLGARPDIAQLIIKEAISGKGQWVGVSA